MSISRIFQSQPLSLNALIYLDEKASHHLARVLRAKLNDRVTLFNGEGGEYHGFITHIDKKKVVVQLSAFDPREAESPIRIHLVQGLVRGEKMDFLIQKAVELGVDRITPLMTERCNVKLVNEREEKRLQHWQSIAISACEQSGRNRVPEVESPISFQNWLPNAKADCSFVLTPHLIDKLPMREAMPATTDILLLIGPEGGLSSDEVTAALQRGFLPLNLGPRILRTETAPLAAMSILQFQFGDLS